MVVGSDITSVQENIRLQAECNALSLMSGYMSHEMITPLKCVAQLADKVAQDEALIDTHN
jgi:hypothetical protein